MSAKRAALLLAVLTATLLSTVGDLPAASAGPRVRVGVWVNVPPPPLRREVVVVRPGPGYFWVPGHWDWAPARRGYVWVAGIWLRPPYPHAVWVGPRWRRRHHRTYFVGGYWRR